jgi:multidrug transporter EmrE-like cation transporter
MFVVPSIRTGSLVWTSQGLVLVGLAGACAFAIDYFALKAYAEGLPVSVGGPLIIGGSIGLAAIIGLAFGESISFIKLVGISLILIGASLLAALSPE